MHKLNPYIILSNLTDHYPTVPCVTLINLQKANIKNQWHFTDRKSFNPESFCDELDKNLGLLVQNQFPLNQENFFDQFVSRIADGL